MPDQNPLDCIGDLRTSVKPFETVPPTEEHLRRVTSVGYSAKLHCGALLIEGEPGTEGEYKLIQINGFADIPNLTSDGIIVIKEILQSFLGCEFVRVPQEGDSDMWVFRRKNLQERIEAYEAEHPE